ELRFQDWWCYSTDRPDSTSCLLAQPTDSKWHPIWPSFCICLERSQQGADTMKNLTRTKLMSGALILAGALLFNAAPVLAQYNGPTGGDNYPPAGQLDSLVSRIALYPDPLLAQIFSAAAFPDQIAAAAQGARGPFDPSVEALMQYPSVLQMMASDLNWTQ